MQFRLRKLLIFSIRDLLWITALAAIGCAWLVDRRAIQTERQALEKVRTSHQASMAKELSLLDQVARSNAAKLQRISYEIREQQNQLTQLKVQEFEIEQAKRMSAVLGAPQPQPFPDGYGEIPQ